MMDYILFLRAVNVAGKNKLKMQDLKLALQSEFLDAQTYIQSGNILIPNCNLTKTQVKSIVEKIVLKNFDIDTTAIIKSSKELQDIMDTIPFQIMETKQLYFCFLETMSTKDTTTFNSVTQYHGDNFMIKKDMVYIQCLNGYGKTKLSNHFFEKKLETSATTGNHNTISKLIEMASKR